MTGRSRQLSAAAKAARERRAAVIARFLVRLFLATSAMNEISSRQRALRLIRARRSRPCGAERASLRDFSKRGSSRGLCSASRLAATALLRNTK